MQYQGDSLQIELFVYSEKSGKILLRHYIDFLLPKDLLDQNNLPLCLGA